MPRKTGRNTKGRIVAAAWKLFYEQGYDNTILLYKCKTMGKHSMA